MYYPSAWLEDSESSAAGAALQAMVAVGNYNHTTPVLSQLADTGYVAHKYAGATDGCVLAMIGSPDAANDLALDDDAALPPPPDSRASTHQATAAESFAARPVNAVGSPAAKVCRRAAGMPARAALLLRRIGYGGRLSVSS